MATGLDKRTYVKYEPGISKISEGEDKAVAGVIEIFDRVLHQNYGKHGHTYPTTHARTLGVVKGKLIVPDNLPAHLKQGPFAKGGEYPVALRYSVNSHDFMGDARQSRGKGLAMKIFNWPGERFKEGAGNTTHDITMNSQYTETELPDAKTALERIQIFEQMLTDTAGGVAKLKARPDAALQLRPIAPAPRFRTEAYEFYSQYAYRFGDYMAKHGLVPASDAQKKLTKEPLAQDKGLTPDLMAWLKEYYSTNEAVYEWKFQLCENLEDQPIDYAGKEWDPVKYPYQTVAKLVFPKQNPCDEELMSFWEDSMRISVWRGLKTMEPFGGANRIRRVLYPTSKVIRTGLNPSTAVDVQKIEDLPGQLPAEVAAVAKKYATSQDWLHRWF